MIDRGADVSDAKLPLTRVATVLRYIHHLQAAGAPVGRLLAHSRIPSVLLEHPEAALPLSTAFRFGELACQSLGTEHIGLLVGFETSLDELGPYGRMLQDSLTLYDYLRKGVSLYNTLITGQRLWLSDHGDELRFNITTVGDLRLGTYQSHLETLAVTLTKFREAAGVDWFPMTISLGYSSREDLPNVELFSGSHLIRGTGETYFTFPRALLGLHFPVEGSLVEPEIGGSLVPRPLPQDIVELVQLQIECLLRDHAIGIDAIAESLTMSRRSLQRSLAKQALTYSQVLAATRARLAARWLARSEKSIAQIAFDLGYQDASNFTRAFRQQTGISPQAFRNNLRS